LVAVRYRSLPILLLASLALLFAVGAGASAQTPEYQVPTPTPSPLQYLQPFPGVRLTGTFAHFGVRVKRLTVTSPRGSKVTLRCAGGKRKGCPYKKKTTTSPKSKKLRFRSIERRLKAGVVLRVYVMRGNTIGKYTSFKIRSGKAPSRNDECLLPGDPTEPTGCPS
jgi:hypothetical protein